jgi:tetratricopeptide (TPR) repeat protein
MNRKTVTLCMIAKDEESTIGQTIKSALAIVDDIIVGDTGSSDNTKLIAEGYGARVLDLVWGDDFSAARNTVLAEVKTDWVLVLDADEKIQPVRPVEFQKLLMQDSVAGYKVMVHDVNGQETSTSTRQVRLFRSHPYVRYCYPIHETIDVALGNWAASNSSSVELSPLAVVHETGGSERQQGRAERNRRLLRDAWQEYPYEPYFAYQLALESIRMSEEEVLPLAGLDRIAGQLQQAWSIITAMPHEASSELNYGPDLAAMLSAIKITDGQFDQALDIIWTAMEIYPANHYLQFRRALAISEYLEAGLIDGQRFGSEAFLRGRAVQDLENVIAHSCRKGTQERPEWTNELALRILGSLSLMNGDLEQARRYFTDALTVTDQLSSAWCGLGEVERLTGDTRKALGYYLRAVTVNQMNVRAWLMGSKTLSDVGFEDNATTWRTRAEQLFPEYHGFRKRGEWVDNLLESVMKPIVFTEST